MTQSRTPPLWELWQIYCHTGRAEDLLEYIRAGGEVTDEVRGEIIKCLSLVDKGKRNPHLKAGVIDDIEWEMASSPNDHVDHGTPVKSKAAIFKEIAEKRGMTVDAVKKIWQRRDQSSGGDETDF